MKLGIKETDSDKVYYYSDVDYTIGEIDLDENITNIIKLNYGGK